MELHYKIGISYEMLNIMVDGSKIHSGGKRFTNNPTKTKKRKQTNKLFIQNKKKI